MAPNLRSNQPNHSMKNNKLKCTTVGALASVAFCANAAAQSPDALLDKLVQKGILTRQEADDLRKETDKDSSKATAKALSLPSWVTSFKLGGDFRGRYEEHHANNPAISDRDRFRYRLRYGVTATLLDDFEVGFRLASGNPNSTFGGNPLSANTDFSDGASRKFIWVDTAYAKWTPIHNDELKVNATIGKMDNPFNYSPMVFDPDYQPEGAAVQGSYAFNEQHALKLNGAAFVLDEFSAGPNSSHDTFMLGAQLRWESKWTPKFESMLGIGAFDIAGKSNLVPGAAPNVNDGNTRDAAGNLLNNYNPVVCEAYLVYKLDSFPLYKGQFPIKLSGEFMKNKGAATGNEAWNGGLTLGKAGKKGLWDISYQYRHIGPDAWYEEFPDDDFTGFYSAALPGSGFGAGIRGGTNTKGHVAKLNYSLFDSTTFTVTYYLGELINNPSGANSTVHHFMADLMWRF